MTKEEIKESNTMSDIISRYGLRPNRAGFICCPFHKEKTPSMKIYKDSYYCFGCGEHGDIFSFVMKYEGVPFSTAFLSLGGTYISRKGKSKNQIRHEIRDTKSHLLNKNNPCSNTSNSELDIAKKSVLLYEEGLKYLEPESEEWYLCQINLEKEKSRYNYLLSKTGGDENS